MRVNLGDKVKCRLTGFTGICIGRAEYLYGCVSCIVQPQEPTKENNHFRITETIDEAQLEVIEAQAFAPVEPESDEPTPKAGRKRTTAGPMPDIQR